MSKTKLVAAGVMLVVSVVMLVGASLAWMTVSTAPEITGFTVNLNTDLALLVSPDGTEGSFEQAIKIGDRFKYFAPLKPVSTADGIHWYLPEYASSGALMDVTKFNLDDGSDGVYDHANVMVYDVTTNTAGEEVYTQMTGSRYFDESNKGYYVYTDFWLMTEEEGGVKVSLSVPNSISSLADWEKGGTVEELMEQGMDEEHANFAAKYGAMYGSYALAGLELDDEGNLVSIDNDAQSCLRVGFLVMNEDGTPVDNSFTIYEPNADKRSDITDKPEGANDAYVLGYALDKSEDGLNYKENAYYHTRPVGQVSDGNGGTTAALVDIPANKLMVQQKSVWDLELALDALQKQPATLLDDILDTASKETVLTSNEVETFGRFVWDNTLLPDDNQTFADKVAEEGVNSESYLAAASSTTIVTLQKDTPQRIRMFIWLEGQDVDCWNDVASGSFIVNLEFAAQSLPVTENTDTPVDPVDPENPENNGQDDPEMGS